MDTDTKDLRKERLAPGGWRPFPLQHRWSSWFTNCSLSA